MPRQKNAVKSSDVIVIDEEKGLSFSSEEELYNHFLEDINKVEAEYFRVRKEGDIDTKDFVKFESQLTMTLNDPDEVWEDVEGLDGKGFTTYIREFKDKEGPVFHLAIVYLTGNIPSFVYLHFPTRDLDLVERYQRGHLIYDEAIKNAPPGALDGDALLEGDPLALGLYDAMLKLRSSADIEEERFTEYADFREPAIEEADEIWRNSDSLGNILVNFIRDFSDEGEKDLHYIVVTIEDVPTNSHSLLFSFPTKDPSLLERYRHGENLQAEEVVQESSH